jgi:hypothetical protein
MVGVPIWDMSAYGYGTCQRIRDRSAYTVCINGLFSLSRVPRLDPDRISAPLAEGVSGDLGRPCVSDQNFWRKRGLLKQWLGLLSSILN